MKDYDRTHGKEGSQRQVLHMTFFFQAEDGIRDLTVTGVQTCALPISLEPLPPTPMPAMFNRLFAPSTLRLATKGKDSALVASTVRFTNWRRVIGRIFKIGRASCRERV